MVPLRTSQPEKAGRARGGKNYAASRLEREGDLPARDAGFDVNADGI